MVRSPKANPTLEREKPASLRKSLLRGHAFTGWIARNLVSAGLHLTRKHYSQHARRLGDSDFFVISGFLITRQIVAGIERDGNLNLKAF
jgi:peptidoglycan/LPS O-acetylase OafA/YrhL